MRCDWEEKALGEITSLITKGITPKYTEVENSETIRVLNQKCNRNFSIAYTDSRLHDNLIKRVPSEKILRVGDVLINSTGTGTAGRVAQIWDIIIPTTIDGHMLLLRCTNDLIPLYYGYAIKAQQKKIESFAEGSTGQTEINRQRLKDEITIKYPLDLAEQYTIARSLKVLDDKIELNRRINANLEQQAQAVYDYMLCHNQCTEGVLSDIADITMGQSPKGSTYNENGTGTVFFQGRGEFGFRFPKRRLYTTEPKRMAQADDVLVSVRAPVGDVNVAREDCCIGRGLCAVHSKYGYKSFILYTMFALRQQLDIFNGQGTVFGAINRDALESLPVTIPLKEVIEHFEKIISPMDKMIRNNYEQTCCLESVRDSLLPKLISGEIEL